MALDTVLREHDLAERQAQERLKAAIAPPESQEERLGLEIQPGTRVLDLVTGQHGEVTGGGRAHTIVPAAERSAG